MTNTSEYAALYRRFRPQRFEEVLGQDHVTKALRNAVANQRVGHAYLFSGPRGTGKTSTARILAKALNCPNQLAGEPCCECPSCISVTLGRSMDVIELDAASNSGVDAIRSLIAQAPVGIAGEWKVYILDEVHMLTNAASNALLKTLEEPPPRVIFVLATTDPQKVLPTILSRTQAYEFRLLDGSVLEDLVDKVRQSADLNIDEKAMDWVVKQGRGSARDTLSFLDQVVALGGIDDSVRGITEIMEAIANQSPEDVLIAVAASSAKGIEPSRILSEIVSLAREKFLDSFNPQKADRRLPTKRLVKVVEVLGTISGQLRDSPDARATVEAALIRLSQDQLGLPSEIESILEDVITKVIKRNGGVVQSIPQNPTTTSHAAPKNNPPQDYDQPDYSTPRSTVNVDRPNSRPPKPQTDISSLRAGLESKEIKTPRSQGIGSRLGSPGRPSNSPNINDASPQKGPTQNAPEPPRKTATPEQGLKEPLRSGSTDRTYPKTDEDHLPGTIDRDQLQRAWPKIVSDLGVGPLEGANLTQGRIISVSPVGAIIGVPNEIIAKSCASNLRGLSQLIKDQFLLTEFRIDIKIQEQVQTNPNVPKIDQNIDSAALIDEFKRGEVANDLGLRKRVLEVFPNATEISE